MASIQYYFHQLVIQKLFIADLLIISVTVAALFVSFLYWVDGQITTNNQDLIQLMSNEVSLGAFQLKSEITQLTFYFNLTRHVVLDSLPLFPTHLSYLVNFQTQQIEPQPPLQQAAFNLYANCTPQTQSPKCIHLAQYLDASNRFNFFAYLKPFATQDVFLVQLELHQLGTHNQLCGRLGIAQQAYRCFLLKQQTNNTRQELYDTIYQFQDQIISTEDCIQVDKSNCAVAKYLENKKLSTSYLSETADFINTLEKGEWPNQMTSIHRNFENSNPILFPSVSCIKSFFYSSKSLIDNATYEVDSEYKLDLLNQTQEQNQRLRDLYDKNLKWTVVSVFSDEIFDLTVDIKEKQYYNFALYFHTYFLLLLFTPLINKIITNSEFQQISRTLTKISLKMDNGQIEYDLVSEELSSMQDEINLTELKELVQTYLDFCWLIDFISGLQRQFSDTQKLEIGLLIFERRGNIECQEIILRKLVQEHQKCQTYSQGIQFNEKLIQIINQQLEQTKLADQNRTKLKLFNAQITLFSLLSKFAVQNKIKVTDASWRKIKVLFQEIMAFTDTLEIKVTMQIKLHIKRVKVLFQMRLIKLAEESLVQAQQLLQLAYTQNKSNFSNKQFNQERKILQILQQQIYYYRAEIYLSGSQCAEAITAFMLALDHGNVYKQKLRVRIIEGLAHVSRRNRSCQAETRILEQIQYFYQNRLRAFDIYIDSTMRLTENQLEIVECIKKLFNAMNDLDQLKIKTFDEKINTVIECESKQDLIELNGRNFMEDGLYDLLSGRQTHNPRRLYSAILDSFSDTVPPHYSKYLIVMTFGENTIEQGNELEEVLDRLREEYCHFILCSSQEKKFLNQRSSFELLTQEARDGVYLDLFANFEVNLTKLISICS